MTQHRYSLPRGTILDCYSIMKMIGSGGFSLIYLAEDEDTLERVVIKEYLPKKMAARRKVAKIEVTGGEKQQNAFHHGRKLFYQEAKALAGLQHPNVVKVRNFFLANGTSYLVMDYEPGKNLGRYIKQREGSLSATFLMNVFPPILDALSLIHSRRHLHLDIKPSNIHLRPGGSPLLLDFGAVHDASRVSQSKTGRVITPGFSPVEQYYASGHVGPWSDVYAIGASMRACIDGKSPPSAIKRHAKDNMSVAASSFAGRYPAYLLQAMDWAMEMDPRRRPQTAGDMLRVLMEQIEQPVAATAKTNTTEQRRAEDS